MEPIILVGKLLLRVVNVGAEISTSQPSIKYGKYVVTVYSLYPLKGFNIEDVG